MAHVHWIGAGLSSGPGIRRLANLPLPITCWNRTVSKAEQALDDAAGTNTSVRTLDWDSLSQQVRAGDVVVSMLPATMHTQVAKLCLANDAHFVSSSYLSEEFSALHDQAMKQRRCLVGEVGLDPGVDHLLAHALVHQYQQSDCFDPHHTYRFRSFCGGLPVEADSFGYKFSWSPLGVLKALTAPARWIDHGDTQTTQRVWSAVSTIPILLPDGTTETFQAYPNRDSIPYRDVYGMGAPWHVDQFVRGTLRYDGWDVAWKEIFELVDNANRTPDSVEELLQAKSVQLWNEHQYQPGERDRVVMYVELEATTPEQTVWRQAYSLDVVGNPLGTAMARWVSIPVSIAVEAVLAGELPAGVQGAPHDPRTVQAWLDKLAHLEQPIAHFNLV